MFGTSINSMAAAVPQPAANPNTGDAEVPQSPKTVSAISFNPVQSDLLAACSWDGEVRIWEIKGGINGKAEIKHEAPLLDLCWNSAGSQVIYGGCDNTVNVWDVATSAKQKIGMHDAPVKSVKYLSSDQGVQMVVSAGWDKKVRYWDPRTAGTHKLEMVMDERVYCMDVRFPVMVAGLAGMNTTIYDLRKPDQPFKKEKSPLKLQTRCVALFNDMTGYAIGSVEGRVGIQVFDNPKLSFAFKCHRSDDKIYPVNSIAFHPLGTFSTAGGDGNFLFWDKDAKQRLKLFKPLSVPIVDCKFNKDGTIFAYACAYDWSLGHAGAANYPPGKIYLHKVESSEIQKRKKK
eukprot:403551_1